MSAAAHRPSQKYRADLGGDRDVKEKRNVADLGVMRGRGPCGGDLRTERRCAFRVARSTSPFVDPERSELAEALEANASGGLDKRVTDGRAVVAAFTRRTYRPGETSVLKLWRRYPYVRIELLHVGPEDQLTIGNETMEGVAVADPIRVAGDHGSVRIPIAQEDIERVSGERLAKL